MMDLLGSLLSKYEVEILLCQKRKDGIIIILLKLDNGIVVCSN